MSQSSKATGSGISGGWQVAPILRADGCDGCNETQFYARVRHTWSLRWARCHGWFYGKRRDATSARSKIIPLETEEAVESKEKIFKCVEYLKSTCSLMID